MASTVWRMGVSPAVSIKPMAIQHSVVALHTQGVSKRKIAKQLGMSVNTVMKILSVRQPETEQYHSDTKQRIIPKAFQAIENAIDTGDANVAMRFLERTALSPEHGDTYQFSGDAQLTQVVQLLPSTPSSTSTPGTASSTGPAVAADPSSQKAPGTDVGLSLRTSFLPFLEKFASNLCDGLLPSLQTAQAGGPVLSRSELLQTLREAAERFVGQEESRILESRQPSLGENTSGEVQGELSASELTPVRINSGTVR